VSSPPAPLAGVRVLDLSRVIAGPFCTQLLGDLGAEVVKVEHPEHGDDSRGMKPPAAGDEAHFYLAFNRSKKSVAIDLGRPEGRDLVHRLAAVSDVLVENFRPGVMRRLGLDWDTMHARHPALIYCSISAYGQTGPRAERPGFDPVLQAESGMMAVNGEPDGDPLRHPIAIVDTFTGLYAATAILAALFARRETGRGQRIELALLDCAVAMLGNVGQYYLTSGQDPARLGNAHPAAVPVGLFKTRTGPFYLACGTDRLYRQLCDAVLRRPDLVADPRFSTNSARVVNREALFAVLERIFAGDTRESWLARFEAAGVAAGAVRPVSQALESDEVRERGLVATVPHPTAGAVRLLRSPCRFSSTPVRPPAAPPLLGEHTDAVLRDLLAFDADQVAALRAAKVVR
jgi:crotonobetainyl-CoA:carnitine CoA-transferase CaiB-like acyl-CoA transferase